MQSASGIRMVLDAPVVISQAPAEVRKWGPWQFPFIQRLPDGRLQIGFHIGEDSATDYGIAPGVAVSKGRTSFGFETRARATATR